MKNKTDLFLFVFGVLLAAAGIILSQNHLTQAASQAYSETYTVSKWRNLRDEKTASPTEYSVGASEWTVSGSVGTTTYTETWKATNWKDRLISTDSWALGSYMKFVDSTTFKAQSTMAGCDHAEALTCQTRDSGDYGVLLWEPLTNKLGSARSVPGKWEVTGTVNTP